MKLVLPFARQRIEFVARNNPNGTRFWIDVVNLRADDPLELLDGIAFGIDVAGDVRVADPRRRREAAGNSQVVLGFDVVVERAL